MYYGTKRHGPRTNNLANSQRPGSIGRPLLGRLALFHNPGLRPYRLYYWYLGNILYLVCLTLLTQPHFISITLFVTTLVQGPSYLFCIWHFSHAIFSVSFRFMNYCMSSLRGGHAIFTSSSIYSVDGLAVLKRAADRPDFAPTRPHRIFRKTTQKLKRMCHEKSKNVLKHRKHVCSTCFKRLNIFGISPKTFLELLFVRGTRNSN